MPDARLLLGIWKIHIIVSPGAVALISFATYHISEVTCNRSVVNACERAEQCAHGPVAVPANVLAATCGNAFPAFLVLALSANYSISYANVYV